MFNFFCNLATAIYYGGWLEISNNTYISNFISYMQLSPIFNMFNNSTENFYKTNGLVNVGIGNVALPQLELTIAVILSTICCISVFFIIVKAVKKLFTCFLGD